MRIVWSTLWFLDYRISVFAELSKIPGVELYLIYNRAVNSESINKKVFEALGNKAIPMEGELKLGSNSVSGMANTSYRIPYQPGLIKRISELKPDVMVSDGFFQWTYAPLYLKATRRIPHVMCYERTNHTERNAQLIRKLYRKMVLRWIDVICCSGKLCGEYVKSLGFKQELTTYGHMTADVKSMVDYSNSLNEADVNTLRNELDLSQTVYLYVGRMIELKGIMNLLKAWRDFTSRMADKPTLLLVGSGEQDDIIKQEIKNYQLSVKFVGRINYEEIAKYYLVADIFIIPTLEDNWSLVLSEAMACSLPVISSVYNGCWPELVQESNGWLINPLDHNNFVNVLTKSYEHRDKFKQMGLASLEIIRNFTPSDAAMSIYKSCQKAIEKRHEGDITR